MTVAGVMVGAVALAIAVWIILFAACCAPPPLPPEPPIVCTVTARDH